MRKGAIRDDLISRGKLSLLLFALLMGMVAILAVACGEDEEEAAPAPAPAAPAAPAAPSAAAAPAAPAPAAPAAPAAAPAAPAPAAPAAPVAAVAPAPTVVPRLPRPAPAVAFNSLDLGWWVAGAELTPKRGGIFRPAGKDAPDTLDPHLTTVGSGFYQRWVSWDNLIRSALVDAATAKYELVGDLATSWEQPDPNTIVIKLRKGVKFHDGSDLDAEVAKWNIDRIRTHPRSLDAPRLKSIDSVDVVDDFTIRLNIPTPNAAQLLELGSNTWMISKAHFEAVGEDAFGSDPSGTGPMRLSKWVPDLKIELAPFTSFWRDGVDGKPMPYLDGQAERHISDGSVAIAELKTGQIDFYGDLEAIQVPLVKDDSDLVYFEQFWTGYRRPLIGFNSRKGPFSDVRLRKAALWALDREAQAKAAGPTAKVHYYPLTYPYFFDYDESRPRYDYQPEKAKALVCEVDPDCQVDVEILIIARAPDPAVALVIKSMWDAVGLNTTIEAQEVVAWVNTARADDFEVVAWYASPYGLDPDSEFTRVDRESGGNWNNNDTPGLQECYERGRIEFDLAKRKTVYDECYQILFDDAAFGVSFIEASNFVHGKAVKGYGSQRVNRFYIHDVWLDR